MCEVTIINVISRVITVKYVLGTDCEYKFNDIYETAYDLILDTFKLGGQILLIGHDKIKQRLTFRSL